MTIGKRKGATSKGAGAGSDSTGDKFGGSLSKNDHFYLQQAFGLDRYIRPPVSATGGTKTTYNGKTIHTFKATSPFSLSSGGPVEIEYVIIGDDGTNIDIVPLPDDTNAITVSKDEASPIKAEDIMSKKYRNLPEEESNVG